jgi:hypothetical protein
MDDFLNDGDEDATSSGAEAKAEKKSVALV